MQSTHSVGENGNRQTGKRLYLYRYSNAGDLDALGRLHLRDCIECGCCAYACPGKLPLVEGFRAGKRALKEGAK